MISHTFFLFRKINLDHCLYINLLMIEEELVKYLLMIFLIVIMNMIFLMPISIFFLLPLPIILLKNCKESLHILHFLDERSFFLFIEII
jgi:hypothetical protein